MADATPTEPNERARPLRPGLWGGVALVAFVVFVLAFFPLRTSHDEWWHLKTGQWIVEHGTLPKTDVFTYTAANYDWDNHEWLSEVLMYLVWHWGAEHGGGWRAVIFVKALFLVATWLMLMRFLVHRAGGGRWGLVVGIFLAILAASVARRTFWPRPPVISYFFLTFFLYVMWLHRSGRLPTRGLLVLPFLMPLWANLHGGFILGGVVVAAYFTGEISELLLAQTARHCKPELGCPFLTFYGRLAPMPPPPPLAFLRRAGIYMGLGVLVGLGSLCTPYGYKLYLLTQRVMSSPDLVERLSELMPPDFHYTWGYAFLLAVLAVGFLALVVRTARGPGAVWPPLADMLLLAFFFWQSWNHVRHLPLMGIAGAPVAAWMLSRTRDAAPERVRGALRWTLGVGSGVMALWLVFVPGEGIQLPQWIGHPKLGRPPSAFERSVALARGMEIEPGTYPVRAVNFILSARLPGRMYNRNHLAGYLIWRLSPEHYRVFTDNRFDIFGGDFLMDELSIANGWPEGFLQPRGTPVPDWREAVERWNIQWLFLERGEKINAKLAAPDSGWVLVYADPSFLIWLKDTPENRPWIERYGRR